MIVIWIIVSVIGALVAAWNLWDAWRDLQALGGVENGRRMINRGWVRREFIRLGVQLTWAWVGIQSLDTTSEVNPIVILLIGTNVALTLNTLLDARERILVRRMIDG